MQPSCNPDDYSCCPADKDLEIKEAQAQLDDNNKDDIKEFDGPKVIAKAAEVGGRHTPNILAQSMSREAPDGDADGCEGEGDGDHDGPVLHF